MIPKVLRLESPEVFALAVFVASLVTFLHLVAQS
jgi:hypothetical protein